VNAWLGSGLPSASVIKARAKVANLPEIGNGTRPERRAPASVRRPFRRSSPPLRPRREGRIQPVTRWTSGLSASGSLETASS